MGDSLPKITITNRLESNLTFFFIRKRLRILDKSDSYLIYSELFSLKVFCTVHILQFVAIIRL